MVDDDEAKSINTRFGNSRQNLINFLAQSRKIVPLTTQGAITAAFRGVLRAGGVLVVGGDESVPDGAGGFAALSHGIYIAT